MTPRLTARRLLSPSILALILAIGTVAGAVGRDGVEPRPDPARVALQDPGPAPTGAVLAADSAARDGGTAWGEGVASLDRPEIPSRSDVTTPAILTGTPGSRPTPTLPKARADSEPRGTKATGSTASGPTRYRGRNHVWIPSLGIDRSVSGYACSNQSYPGDRVYRWGCAGANNIYLFGHAHSVFKALHDAYVRGTLRKGQELFYADANGTVRRYTVSWWKVTTPTKGTWAYAAQSSPSVTLQTCVGSKSQYRLIVRLERAD